MVDRVQAAQTAQEKAKEAFQDALEQFTDVVDVDGGKLEAKYKKLNRAFIRSEERAQEVRDRIEKVESVAEALFKEWRGEFRQYTSPDMRRQSQRQYDETLREYQKLISTMKAAAATMDPVLNAFRDQVLFLKHNLNARAIASIQVEAQRIQSQVADLINDMEVSIAEAEAFIRKMQ